MIQAALLALLLAPPADATFPQLISVRLPAETPPPPPSRGLEAVDLAKLPPGVKPIAGARNQVADWVVTDAGLYRLEGDRYLPAPVGPDRPEPGAPPVRAGTEVVDLVADDLGNFWMASQVGLLVSDGRGWWQTIDRRDGVPFEVMTCLHLPANGDVWGGTTKGAWRLRDGHFRYFQGKRWLPGDKVSRIWSDDSGRVWLDTDAGLARIEERPITLAQKAAHFEEITATRHDRRGYICETILKTPGDPDGGSVFEVSDNDGLWTAVDVAASSFRFAATKAPEARARAKRSMTALLDLERLTGIPGYPARAVVTDDELTAGVRGSTLRTPSASPASPRRSGSAPPSSRTSGARGTPAATRSTATISPGSSTTSTSPRTRPRRTASGASSGA